MALGDIDTKSTGDKIALYAHFVSVWLRNSMIGVFRQLE